MTASETPGQGDHSVKQEEPGASWKQNEQVLPKNRLGIVNSALVCTIFLGILNQTIVATARPAIVTHLPGENYSWVGSAYLLGGGASTPLYGKLSDMFGRKQFLYSCMVVFLLGSALCGVAQSMSWLIVCRALQGIGGGGLNQLAMTTVSDIVPSEDQGRYGGLLGAVYGIASLTAPLLGGVLAQHVSWRWCFFINLPLGGIVTVFLVAFLHVNPPPQCSIRDQIAEFDFIGLFSLVLGVIFLLVGLSFGEQSWNGPRVFGPLIIGVALLVLGGINEMFTKRAALFPPILFKTRTTFCILAAIFLRSMVFIPTIYYLPIFYQVLGSSATLAGIKLLPFLLGSCSVSVISGFIVSKVGRNNPAIWFGSALYTIGIGLMIALDYNSSLLLGATVGLAVDEAILATMLPRYLATIPNIDSLGLGNDIASLTASIGKVHLISDVSLRNAVLHAWARSIATIWMVSTGLAGAALFVELFMQEHFKVHKTPYNGEVRVEGSERRWRHD